MAASAIDRRANIASTGGRARWKVSDAHPGLIDRVERGGDRDITRLVAIPRGGRYRVLDSGAAGSIRDLAFGGRTLSWMHDGVRRSDVA